MSTQIVHSIGSGRKCGQQIIAVTPNLGDIKDSIVIILLFFILLTMQF